jgi:hypothetical protein
MARPLVHLGQRETDSPQPFGKVIGHRLPPGLLIPERIPSSSKDGLCHPFVCAGVGGKGRKRWSNRWKGALNCPVLFLGSSAAFTIIGESLPYAQFRWLWDEVAWNGVRNAGLP